MTDKKTIIDNNSKVLHALSCYINNCPDAITEKMVKDLCDDCGFSAEKAFRILLAGALDLYENKEILNGYFGDNIRLLPISEYQNDRYYKNIKLDFKSLGNWTVETKKYAPFELFVYNDLKKLDDGRIIPHVGFFDREYSYPCILQNGREWMLITPNEIETMKTPIEKARGNVLTYGLGLGYFAYMVSNKADVSSVTIIERDKSVIELFEKLILPQFENKEKIRIIDFDALFFAAEQKNKKHKEFDFVFADIWHDPSDGKDIYRILKTLERSDTEYCYWIEDTIKCYL